MTLESSITSKGGSWSSHWCPQNLLYEFHSGPQWQRILQDWVIDWDYDKGEVNSSMEPYLWKALSQLDSNTPKKWQDFPYPHIEPKYGAKEQFAKAKYYDTSPAVWKDGQKHIQKVNGIFLWYRRAVDPTSLVPLSASSITIRGSSSRPPEIQSRIQKNSERQAMSLLRSKHLQTITGDGQAPLTIMAINRQNRPTGRSPWAKIAYYYWPALSIWPQRLIR